MYFNIGYFLFIIFYEIVKYRLNKRVFVKRGANIFILIEGILTVFFTVIFVNPCHLQFVPFEQLKSENPWIRLAREKIYIRKFESLLNRRT